MFCPKCGAACEENMATCPACGVALQEKKVKIEKIMKLLDRYLGFVKEHWIWLIGVVSVVALILGIANVFCMLQVYRVAEIGLLSDRGYETIANVAKTLKSVGGSFAWGIIGNILFGLTCLVVGGVGILYFLKKYKNMDYYDRFVAKYIKTQEPAFLMGVAGCASVLVQVLFYLFCGITKRIVFVKVRVGVNWLTWVALLMFAVLAATAYLLKKKEN